MSFLENVFDVVFSSGRRQFSCFTDYTHRKLHAFPPKTDRWWFSTLRISEARPGRFTSTAWSHLPSTKNSSQPRISQVSFWALFPLLEM